MIGFEEVANAFAVKLEAAAVGLPIHYEGKAGDLPARPYLLFEASPEGRQNRSLDGASELLTGSITVTVMEKNNTFLTTARAKRSEVMAVFTPNSSIPVAGGCVQITGRSERPEYSDGVGHRIPARIMFQAF